MTTENEIIAAARRAFGSPDSRVALGIGDDTAILRPLRDPVLFTTDMMAQDTHFRLDWIQPAELAAKALAVNVSDIAAMGGEPIAAVVSLGLSGAEPPTFLPAFIRGLRAAAKKWNVAIVGGDTVRAPHIVINIALIGRALPHTPRRDAARPGHRVLITGAPGESYAGFLLLEKLGRSAANKPWMRRLIRRHIDPEPRIAAARALAPHAAAMMDLSDGIATDLPRIAAASGFGLRLQLNALPLSADLCRAAEFLNRDPAQLALAGGEDYELLITAPPRSANAILNLASDIRLPVSHIGDIVPRSQGNRIVLATGKTAPWPEVGFRHF